MLTDNEKFEIKAGAFNRMTGIIAPGKDSGCSLSRYEREVAWDEWCEKYGDVFNAIIHQIGSIEMEV